MPRAALSNVSLKQLVAELKKRQGRLTTLLAKREAIRKVIAEHDAIDREIKELQALGLSADIEQAPMATARRGRPPGKPGRKPGRTAKVAKASGKPLAEYVKEVLADAGKVLRVKEIEAKVLAAGYPTRAKSIYIQIIKVLAKGFKKVSRGVYGLKAGVVAAATGPVAVLAKVAPKAKGGRRRGQFAQTAEEFVTGLLKGGAMTSTAINAAWKKAGRAGDANVTLSKMTKARKLKRVKLKEGRGSTYTVTPAPF